ncbi:MAG: glycosyltransferase, partial [Lactococcus lactis]|nr:glycosyltransferase [Lactococcus lactis]
VNLIYVILKNFKLFKNEKRTILDKWHLLNLRKKLKGEEYDLVILLNPYILYVNEIKDIIHTNKIICWTHGTYEDYVNNRFKEENIQLFNSMRSADKIISIESETAKNWRKINHNVSVIPNPVTIVNNIGDSNLENNKIGFIGRIDVYQKGLDYFCEMVSKLDASFKVLLAGDGTKDEVNNLKEYIKKFGIEKRVNLVGPLKGKDLEEFYKSLSVLVMTSRYEGFGLVAIEAMEFGVPFVGFDIAGLRQVTKNQEYGKLVPLGDTSSMAKTITELLNDRRELLKFSSLSKKRAKQLSVENVIKKWENELGCEKKELGDY